MKEQVIFLIGTYEYQDENGEWESDRFQICAIPTSEAVREELSCCIHDGGVWDGQCLIINGYDDEHAMDLTKHVLLNMPDDMQEHECIWAHGPIMRNAVKYYIEKCQGR